MSTNKIQAIEKMKNNVAVYKINKEKSNVFYMPAKKNINKQFKSLRY